jgi:hypothetical protein
MANNTAGLIALLDAVTPTVNDIAGEDHFPEKDRLALADLNHHIQKAQHIASQPRVKRLLDTWNGVRLVKPVQHPEEDERLPVASPAPDQPRRERAKALPPGERRQAVIDYIRSHPGCMCEDVSDAVGLSRSGTYEYLRSAVFSGQIVGRAVGRAVEYYPATEEPAP